MYIILNHIYIFILDNIYIFYNIYILKYWTNNRIKIDFWYKKYQLLIIDNKLFSTN